MKLFFILALSFTAVGFSYAQVSISDDDYQALLKECDVSYAKLSSEAEACKYGVKEYLNKPNMGLVGISRVCDEKYPLEEEKTACENGGVIVSLVLFLLEVF